MTVNAVRMMLKHSSSSRSGSPTPPVTATPPPASSGTPTSIATTAVFDNFTIDAIHRHVHTKFAAKQPVIIAMLSEELKRVDIIPEETSQMTMWRLLHTMGFRYKTSRRKRYVKKETLDIVCRGVNALRSLMKHRQEGRRVVYVDETWFTTRMHNSKEWVDTTQPTTSAIFSRQVPPGEGEHFVVVAGGTDEGFIDESFLCYTAKNKTGDYHGETNSTLFIHWLKSQLLPALAESLVLVLDSAPYYSQLTEETCCPTTATRKAEIVKWLECRSQPFPPHATHPELLLLCKENQPKPRYTVDKIIRSWGHEVIRLPPAHPELNAIEQVWGCMKKHVRSTLQRFTQADLQVRLQEAKLIATKEVWVGAERRSRFFEEE